MIAWTRQGREGGSVAGAEDCAAAAETASSRSNKAVLWLQDAGSQGGTQSAQDTRAESSPWPAIPITEPSCLRKQQSKHLC